MTALAISVTLALASAFPARAAGGQTGNIAGQVVDSATKAPLPNVAVRAASPSGSYTAHTDARGTFTFIGLSIVVQGVTVQGDQTLNLKQVVLNRALKTIGRTSARPGSQAYQPTQTDRSNDDLRHARDHRAG